MPPRRDVVIIGAGHNGLVTAFYLARAGLKPLVLERRSIVGGAAITEEFHPGFRCSTLAHAVGPLARIVCEEMRLGRQGLELIRPDPVLFAPSLDGRALILYRDSSKCAHEISKFSRKDAEKFPEFQEALALLGKTLEAVMCEPPPSIEDPGAGDIWNLLKIARRLRNLGKKQMYRLMRWGPMPVADLVAEWFENEPLRATLAANGIFGSFLGPRSPGSSVLLLMRTAGDACPAGAKDFPKGGMGSLTQAMAAAAREAGAEIRTGAEVLRINVKGGAVAGVTLSRGEEIPSQVVISNADPKRTFLKLIDPANFDPAFLIKMQNFRCFGSLAKVNLALAGLPTFTALQADASNLLGGRIHIGPETDYLERAFDDAKYGAFSRQPILEIVIPSIADPSLVPSHRHVMSISAQFAPFKLKEGAWEAQRDVLGDAVVNTLARYAPDLPGLILGRQVITPRDLEETYTLTGGHIFHGELALDQIYAMRPALGWARYSTPLQGLYLCGSGAHPGTGVNGLSGRNAAREILRDRKRGKIK